MVKKLYKKVGKVKIYLADIYGYHVNRNEILVGERESHRELVLLEAMRSYNLHYNGAKKEQIAKSVEPVMAKCRRNPLLVPHRILREEAQIHRREKNGR